MAAQGASVDVRLVDDDVPVWIGGGMEGDRSASPSIDKVRSCLSPPQFTQTYNVRNTNPQLATHRSPRSHARHLGDPRRFGSTEACSMSGFVSSSDAASRTASRCGLGVSPS